MTYFWKRRCLGLVLGLSLILSVTTTVRAELLPKGITQVTTVEGITEYRLDNGLKVLLMPDASKPTVTVNITYLVGSRHENYGETGMAHLLEHMMFKGTLKNPKIDVDFNKRGMHSNASTALDRTNYFELFQASDENLRWAIAMEADRMVNSSIAKSALDSEMTVVRNEYESGENSPGSVLFKRLQSVAFDWHNYGHPTIGNRSDIENVKIENLRAFYRMYYQPDNAVLFIAGKFDTPNVIKWVAQAFGGIPKPKRQLPVFWTVEPEQDGERSFVVRRKGDMQFIMVAYKVPASLHPDKDAMSFAADIMTDDPSGRLYKTLVQTGKAVQVFGSSIGSYAPGLQVIGAMVKKEDPIEPVRDALISAIESFSTTPPSQEEMDRMKLSYRNRVEKVLTEHETIGLELSEFIALGDWRYFFQNRDRLEQVSSEQVASAAARYFKRDNRTVGLFIPEDNPQRADIPGAPDIESAMKDFKPKQVIQNAEAFDVSHANIDKRTQHLRIGGMDVAIINKKNRGETVSVALSLHWGDEKSLFNKKWISALTDDMLMRGNRQYTRQQLDDAFSRLKIQGSIYRFDTTREHLADALALVTQVLKEPSFPESEFEQLKKLTLANLESARSEPNLLAVEALDQHFNRYPKGDWRASETVDESIAAVNAVTLADIKAFHQGFYGASKGELAIVGDVDMAGVRSVLEQGLGKWSSPAPYTRIGVDYADIAPVAKKIDTPDKENGFYVARMNLNLRDDDADYPALVVANYLFGGGASLNSRVMERIRQKEGLSYGGGSRLRVGSLDRAGSFTVSAIAAPQNLDKVSAAIREELVRVIKDGFSAEEVARAKSGLKQQEVQSRSHDGTLAKTWTSNLYLQRSFAWSAGLEDKIDKLTTDQVNAAFRKWIDPAKMTVIIAGSDSKAGVKKSEHQ